VRPRSTPGAAALLLAFALATAGCAAPGEAPPLGAPAAPSRPEIREIDGAAPDDLVLQFRTESATRSSVGLWHKDHLVALRRGDAHAAGLDQVWIQVPHRDERGLPFVWETTRADTLETTRGLVRFDVDGRPHLRMSDPPVPLEREAHHLHTCRSQEDGQGGFTVLCRVVGARAQALNLTGATSWELTSSFTLGTDSIQRFDLPARPDSADGRVLAYAEGLTGVVVRVEASFLPGEERPSLAMLASDREQPRPRSFHHFRSFF
jgi:hypothetical protein